MILGHITLAATSLNAAYSGLLSFFRHVNFEGRGAVDTFGELVLNSAGVVVVLAVNRESLPLCISLGVASVLLAIRSYRKYVRGKTFHKMDLSGKVFIVTGSNTGIGLETANELVSLGGTVILACRSVSKANKAKEEIIQRTFCSSKNVIVMECDLCSFESIRSFVKKFQSMGLPLHCLVNNAGLMVEERTLTKNGFETVFTANHLGPFLLTHLLLPMIELTHGRIVMLSSSLHWLLSRVNIEDIMLERPGAYGLFTAYSQSKLVSLMCATELQRRLTSKHSRVTVNSVHPGLVRTDIPRHMSPFMKTLNLLVLPILLTLQKTPVMGAYSTLYAITDSDLEGVGGKYISNCSIVDCNPAVYDKESTEIVWKLSEELTGLLSS
mmetsp:Transcript_29172/g.29524  ORF Transcript_29172/g.29524 Transcript_29172/m.29524 type:complete len:382 (+) Transcript_29172:56-1201(+)